MSPLGAHAQAVAFPLWEGEWLLMSLNLSLSKVSFPEPQIRGCWGSSVLQAPEGRPARLCSTRGCCHFFPALLPPLPESPAQPSRVPSRLPICPISRQRPGLAWDCRPSPSYRLCSVTVPTLLRQPRPAPPPGCPHLVTAGRRQVCRSSLSWISESTVWISALQKSCISSFWTGQALKDQQMPTPYHVAGETEAQGWIIFTQCLSWSGALLRLWVRVCESQTTVLLACGSVTGDICHLSMSPC